MEENSDISEIHEDLFTYLTGRNEKDKSVRFTLRRSNMRQRLSKGYWFLGNENYLVVSFWSGFDYAHKTPNLYFRVLADSSCGFEIVCREDNEKIGLIDLLVEKSVIPGLKPVGKNQFRSDFDFLDTFQEGVNYVITQLKPKIDLVIEEWHYQEEADYEPIYQRRRFLLDTKIDKRDFNKALTNIRKYRDYEDLNNNRTYYGLNELEILDFGPIKQLNLSLPKEKPQFIFFTGENGGGKSYVLQAIASSILRDSEFVKNEFKKISSKILVYKARKKSNLTNYANPKSNSLCPIVGYGPIRVFQRSPSAEDFEDHNYHYKFIDNLFNYDSALIEFYAASEFFNGNTNQSAFRIRPKLDAEIIRLTLIELIDKKFAVNFPADPEMANVSSHNKITYSEIDQNGEPYTGIKLTFDKLSSGLRSLIAFCGDMLIKLAIQQPEIKDVAELKGIVIVDEIDLHFHPAMQKRLIELLSVILPRVQFLVTTHSPIPMLGAPEKSLFVRVNRDPIKGTKAELINVEVENLLPNSILTSPLFNLISITSNAQKEHYKIRTEDKWREIQFNDKVQERLSSIYSKLKKDAEN
jgi:energy-coupling factor transporter ATP-binding protein EcfA2